MATRTSAASQSIADTLALLNEVFAPQRRMVHAGDVIYQGGERFGNLYVLNSGFFKIVNLAADGREQVVGLKFRGDWLGFDGIAGGRYTLRRGGHGHRRGLGAALRGAARRPAPRSPRCCSAMHEAMSREIARDRDSLMSVCTLPADARVADFLRYWAESLRAARHAHRPDHAAHDARRDRQLPRA